MHGTRNHTILFSVKPPTEKAEQVMGVKILKILCYSDFN